MKTLQTEQNIGEKSINIDNKVLEAQVKLLYRQTMTGLIGIIIVAFAACITFWQVIPQWKLSLWMGLVFLITIVRGGVLFSFQRKLSEINHINLWLNLHFSGVVLSGLMWSLAFLFLWPTEHSVYQLVWPIFILPLSGAAVATYYIWKPSYISFLLLTTIPSSLRLFYEGGTLFIILGIICIFYIYILLRAGRVMHSSSVHAFKARIRNEVLNEGLKNEINTREQLNLRLKNEISERKSAEKEIRKLSKVFLDGTNPIILGNLNGEILEVNDETVNVYGFSREELINKSINLLVPNESHERMNELIKLCIQGKLIRDMESFRRKKDGDEIPVLMTLSLLTDEANKPFGIAFLASNITKQKNIEKELIISKAVVESANATKDKFFKIISHDLRSPFNSILGFSNLLNAQYDSFDDMERKDLIQNIDKSATYAYNLLENLLSWSRTQTNEIKINKENFNLNKLVEKSVSPYLSNANSKNISIVNSINPELTVFVDENTALTFIRNIVSNAIKFTHKGGKINIDANIDQNRIKIYIKDTGVGMSPEVLGKLFKIDKDISREGTNHEKGTGLGLILSKEFVEKNGGSIIVKSQENKGSEFIISLPLNPNTENNNN